MPEKQIQEYLFQHIKEVLPPGRSLVETISEVLHVSPDSAYRRIRGETLLVLEEARVLCEQFSISLDQLLQLKENSVVFQNMGQNTHAYDFRNYLSGILREMKKLHASDQKSIIYITSDIPIFHQFCSEPVFAFRYFFWMKTMMQHPDFIHRTFSPDCLTPDVKALGKEILSLYCRIPSVEIWNTESINSILLQVDYYCQAGLMRKEEANDVCQGLRRMLEHLQVQAEYGRKFLPGENPQSKRDNFQLFYNRVGLGDTAIMTLHDDRKTLYLNYDTVNYLTTTDAAFCHQVYLQLQTIMRRSTLISSVSEKQRTVFFNILYAKLPVHAVNQEKMTS